MAKIVIYFFVFIMLDYNALYFLLLFMWIFTIQK